MAEAATGAGYPKSSDLQTLARAIHGEARGEPYEGQVAVGAVILNRVRHVSFPKSVHGVVFQPGAFTAVADGQIWIPLPENASAMRAARDALAGWDPSGGCIYYWNPVTATSKWIWSRPIVKQIGKHNFAK
ncbi:N-acetylmuramoyl-L-alanine amidase [Heliophilum fasciatum]|nr:N-acetylmuramoyl-L-alanine amidase [Heliophilum fasciatum]